MPHSRCVLPSRQDGWEPALYREPSLGFDNAAQLLETAVVAMRT